MVLGLTFSSYSILGQSVAPLQPPSPDTIPNAALPARKLYDPELRPLDPGVEIERMIIDQMKELDRVAGFPTRIRKTNKATFADFALGVGINVDEIKGYANKAGVKRLKQYLNFILAHEKSHQVLSFRDPRSNTPRSPEESRLYECQADILAAKYMIEAQGVPSELDIAMISDVLNVAYVIGNEGLSAGAHPTREQRRAAVRIGMTAGLIVVMARQPPGPGLWEMLTVMGDLINWHPGEDLLFWSYRTARKVVHFGRSASRDIVLLKDPIVDWDRRAENPYVTYKYTYKNFGSRPIKMEMDFQCIWVPRDEPNDTFRWKKWSQKTYRFELRPGEAYTFSGQLAWGPLDDDALMPRFIAPANSSFALATFEYADEPNGYIPGPINDDGAALAEKMTRLDPRGVSALTLAMGLLIRSGADGFKSSLIGPGEQFEGETRYPSEAIVPGSADTWIWNRDEGNSYLTAELYKGKVPSNAAKVFEDFQAKLRLCYPTKVFTKKEAQGSTSTVKSVSFLPNDSGAKVTLSILNLKSSERWIVELQIIGATDRSD